MECRIPMRRVCQIVVALIACLLGIAAHGERTVVLVTNSDCAIDSMTMLEVRKAYFGLMVGDDKRVVRAYRLNGDDDLAKIFYQTVVAMSESSYERRLLSMLLKHGTPRPREFDGVDELLAAVESSNCGIGYVWGADARQAEGVKELRLLWQGE